MGIEEKDHCDDQKHDGPPPGFDIDVVEAVLAGLRETAEDVKIDKTSTSAVVISSG